MHPQSSSEVQTTGEAIGKGLMEIFYFITGNQDGDVNLSCKDRVPRFWADTIGDFLIANLIMLGVGICFGAIHCIGWSFPFPMHTELLMWRVSSVAITTVPVSIPLMYSLGAWLYHIDHDTVAHIFGISIIPAGLLYIIARVVTLVLALTSLRDLAPGAFDTVHWTTFIPHV